MYYQKWVIMLMALLLSTIAASAQNVTVEWNNERQHIDGFGVSDAWFADDIRDHTYADSLMDLLFDQNKGIGLSLLRQRFERRVFNQNGTRDWNHKNYVASGWTAQQAIARGVDKIMISAWTASSWMKDNDSGTGGGRLLWQYFDDYAATWAEYIQKFESDYGVDIYGISPQNEPGVKSWESMVWQKDTFNIFLRDFLRVEFDNANLTTNVIVPEETAWNIPKFGNTIVNDPITNDFVDILAAHVYGGNPEKSFNNLGKTTWQTEWSYDTSPEDYSIENGVTWAYNFHRLLTGAEVSLTNHWWGVNFQNQQEGLIKAYFNKDDINIAKRLWTIGNYSKFIRPNYKRIVSDKEPITDVFVSTYKDPSTNKFVMVVINKTTSNQTLNITFDGFTVPELTPHRTSGSEDLKQLSNISAGGLVQITVPGTTVTTFVGDATSTNVHDFQVSASANDAEEKSDDTMDLTSGDLDFGDKPNNGMIFTGVNIPQGATINSAYLQFTADSDNQNNTANYTIKGEDINNASSFTSTYGNISGRSFTSSSVSWNVPAWNTAGESDDNHKTPDLSSVIQEIVDRNDWSSGNNLALYVTGISGKRSAVSYDADAQKAPKLFVVFEVNNQTQVSQSSDDAEEGSSSMDLTSGDLDFGDKSHNGIRFQNVAIEQGASITNAYIQFTADDNNQSASASYTIYGEDVDNAATFTIAANDISGRTYTSASVAWNNIPAWNTAGETGEDQKTPDLSTIVQEIVDRGGWSNGNAMTFFINGNSGKRSARTYDADPAKAAQLVIEYTTAGRRLNNEKPMEEQITVSEALATAIYPNPATEILTINASEKSELLVYNLSGKLVKSATLRANHNKISIIDLPTGFYILKVANKTFKLIKE